MIYSWTGRGRLTVKMIHSWARKPGFLFFKHMGLSLLSGSCKSMCFRSRGAGLATWGVFIGQLWLNFRKGYSLFFPLPSIKCMIMKQCPGLRPGSHCVLFNVTLQCSLLVHLYVFCKFLYRSAVLTSNQRVPSSVKCIHSLSKYVVSTWRGKNRERERDVWRKTLQRSSWFEIFSHSSLCPWWQLWFTEQLTVCAFSHQSPRGSGPRVLEQNTGSPGEHPLPNTHTPTVTISEWQQSTTAEKQTQTHTLQLCKQSAFVR